MNAARDLAATGTPGPWWAIPADSYYNPSVATREIDGTSSLRHSDVWVAECLPDNRGAADAEKIARAVNALGPLGDLLDVVAHHRPTVTSGEVDFSITEGPNVVNQRDFCACGVEWPCALTRTAAAVEASLRGEVTA